MDLFSYLSLCALSFSKHIVGITVRPYQTYRFLVEKGKWGELVYIGLMVCGYFALASVVKTAAFRPFLLTKQFIVLFSGAIAGYLLIVGLMGIAGIIFKKGKMLEGIAVAWGYSLLPTTFWFSITSLLYILIPPPRTESAAGIMFSLVYLTMSAILLFWKSELYYLTLRFGFLLDLPKIIVVSLCMLPFISGYSVLMYKMGVFRVPFL